MICSVGLYNDGTHKPPAPPPIAPPTAPCCASHDDGIDDGEGDGEGGGEGGGERVDAGKPISPRGIGRPPLGHRLAFSGESKYLREGGAEMKGVCV